MPVLNELPNIRTVLLDSNNIGRLDRYTFSGNPRLKLISLEAFFFVIILEVGKAAMNTLPSIRVFLFSDFFVLYFLKFWKKEIFMII